MKISNDVSSFKGFAVQAGRDCLKESKARVRVAARGNALAVLIVRQNRMMKAAVKAFGKDASLLQVRGCV